MSRFAFALKPKWILGHLLVVVLIIGFVNAGIWQLHRLSERRAFNDQVVAHMDRPVTPVADVLGVTATFTDVDDELNRRVSATGHYLRDQELVINGQASPDSVPGLWIVTPLQLDDGRVLLVNRGWLPSRGPLTAPPGGSEAPAGEVTVTGLVAQTQVPAAGESADTSKAHQSAFLRIDIARIQEQFPQKLVPAFLLRRAQNPPDPGARPPQDLDPPELSNGPHLGYAFQWFGFTLVALIGYPLLLWIIGRDRDDDGPDRPEPDPDDLPPGAFIDDDGILDVTGVRTSAPTATERDATDGADASITR